MKEQRTYELPKDALAEHQREILGRHLCTLFLPVSFWETEAGLTMTVDTTGWIPLQAVSGLSASEAIALLWALIKGWEEAEDRYLMPERLCWEPEAFYVPVFRGEKIAGHGGVCLAVPYVPGPGDACCIRTQVVQRLGEILRTRIPEGERGYLQRAVSLLSDNPYGMTSCLRSLERLKREIYRQQGVVSQVAAFFQPSAEEFQKKDHCRKR